jgi:hypothetical protein
MTRLHQMTDRPICEMRQLKTHNHWIDELRVVATTGAADDDDLSRRIDVMQASPSGRA